MTCSPEFLEEIRKVIECTEYGTIEITLNERGSFVEVIRTSKVRLDKDKYHLG